ncbi:MAG TPA: hypothetical protein VJQ44_09095 [Gemmatimonadales bacterium]|nr:hypothetical protein [Gemmatimonadales bacterium]
MTESFLRSLLGSGDDDPGCDAAFAVFDEYCDAIQRGDPAEQVTARYSWFLTHVANCTTCREDLQSLLAILRDEDEGRR